MSTILKDPTNRTITIVVLLLVVAGGVLLTKTFLSTPSAEERIQVQVSEARDRAQRTFTIAIKNGVAEPQILDLKAFIEQQSSVQSVQYQSAAVAYANLEEKYKDNPAFLASLRELGPSSLGDTLTVEVKDASQRATLVASVRNSSQGSIIENINRD